VGILDIHLGADNGVVLARALLAAGRLGRVVFFSSETDPEVLADATCLGSVAHNVASLRAILDTLR
jgi:hypothetical protein